MELVAGFVVGVVMGGLFFGGLWVTAGRVVESSRPGVLLLGSYLIRLALVGAGFYGVLSVWGIPPVFAALLGLLLTRVVLLRRLAVASSESGEPRSDAEPPTPSNG